MTGPIRYTIDKGLSTYFTWFDQRVEWVDMIYWLTILVLTIACWQFWRKGKED